MYESKQTIKMMEKKRKKERERNKRKMKYDFVCKSDPVSHINNRKTTTRDKSNREEHKRYSSFTALYLQAPPAQHKRTTTEELNIVVISISAIGARYQPTYDRR